MRIQANPDRALLLRPEPGRSAHRHRRRQRRTRPRATSTAPRQAYTIGANDQLLTSADYKPLIVAYRNGAPVMLSDVADVVDDAENVQAGRVDERHARR